MSSSNNIDETLSVHMATDLTFTQDRKEETLSGNSLTNLYLGLCAFICLRPVWLVGFFVVTVRSKLISNLKKTIGFFLRFHFTVCIFHNGNSVL